MAGKKIKKSKKGSSYSELSANYQRVLDHLTCPIKPPERKKLLKNITKLFDSIKSSKKKAAYAEALVMAVDLLKSKKRVLHLEMVSVYGPVFGHLFSKPKDCKESQHNYMSYITLLTL